MSLLPLCNSCNVLLTFEKKYTTSCKVDDKRKKAITIMIVLPAEIRASCVCSAFWEEFMCWWKCFSCFSSRESHCSCLGNIRGGELDGLMDTYTGIYPYILLLEEEHILHLCNKSEKNI